MLCAGWKNAADEEYVKNIEIGDASIDFNLHEFPVIAYLRAEFKNNGDKKISNLTLEIKYYDDESFLLEKAVIKDALTEAVPKGEAIPKGEKVKYKIRLKGDIVNIEHEQYPYSQQEKVSRFEIKIISVRFASK